MTQEPRTDVPERIRSISGANKRRHSSGSEPEPEEEPSSSEEEEEEQKEATEKSSGSAVNAAEEAEGGVGKAGAEQPLAGPRAPEPQAAPSRAPCKPAVFIPVHRTPEIQVRLWEQHSACHRGWGGWWAPAAGCTQISSSSWKTRLV